jgi:transposase-like protein
MKKIDFRMFDSLVSVADYFKTQKKCKQALIEIRWGDDIVCPYCGAHHCKMSKTGRFHCTNCNHNFSCTVGTIFENTKISLRLWFLAMYLISSHKKGVSSHQLSRDIKVTQKTAWYMLQKIRTLYAQSDEKELSGIVECDEMYLGGAEKNKHENKKTEGTQGRSTKTKKPIFGMIQRHGKIVAMTVNDTKADTLMPIIKQFVAENTVVYTDELSSYSRLSKENYAHGVVHHNDNEFVVGDIFTNTIEGFWSHFKKMTFGIYHSVSKKHLQRYIDEEVFRWNTRKMSESYRFGEMFVKAIFRCRYDDVKNVA